MICPLLQELQRLTVLMFRVLGVGQGKTERNRQWAVQDVQTLGTLPRTLKVNHIEANARSELQLIEGHLDRAEHLRAVAATPSFPAWVP